MMHLFLVLYLSGQPYAVSERQDYPLLNFEDQATECAERAQSLQRQAKFYLLTNPKNNGFDPSAKWDGVTVSCVYAETPPEVKS